MKNSNLLIIILFATLSSFAQVNYSPKDINSILVGKWRLDYALYKEEKMMIPMTMNLEFLANNTFIVSGKDAKSTNGEWSLDFENKRIVMKHGEKLFHIVSLTDQDFLWAEIDDNPMTRQTIPNSKFHFSKL